MTPGRLRTVPRTFRFPNLMVGDHECSLLFLLVLRMVARDVVVSDWFRLGRLSEWRPRAPGFIYSLLNASIGAKRAARPAG